MLYNPICLCFLIRKNKRAIQNLGEILSLEFDRNHYARQQAQRNTVVLELLNIYIASN